MPCHALVMIINILIVYFYKISFNWTTVVAHVDVGRFAGTIEFKVVCWVRY